jgi:hypothetical protein
MAFREALIKIRASFDWNASKAPLLTEEGRQRFG